MIEYRKHYAAGSAELRFGGKSTGFKNLNIIFDSGSSYTYFDSQIYHALLTFVSSEYLYCLTDHKVYFKLRITCSTSVVYYLLKTKKCRFW